MKPNWGTVVSTTRDAVCHHCGSSSRVYGENKTIFDVRLAEFFERHKRCPPPRVAGRGLPLRRDSRGEGEADRAREARQGRAAHDPSRRAGEVRSRRAEVVMREYVPPARDLDDDVPGPPEPRPRVRVVVLRPCGACGTCVSCELRAARQRRLARTEVA